jgi:hypothetical protein
VAIAASGDPITDLRIVTGAAAAVAGRVEWNGSAPRTGSTTALRIITSPADGRPALIGLLGAGDPGANGTVAADDAFHIGNLLGTVRFSPVGVPPRWELEAVVVDGVDVTTTGIDVGSLAADTQVRVILTDQVTELTGSVRDAKQQPVAEYVVVVLPEQPVDAAVAARYTRLLRPDQGGGFRVRGLPAGRYAAVAIESLEQGTEWDPAFQRAARQIAQRFTLGEGQARAVTLELIR